ncbi:efflux transporter outer membrane subunit [Alcaligenes endophyticus]|uniref:Efflux transporter outer membrane subunit n=1 Tax=Alcaligenes endophyticus TaxID=1929088 RepID=A0ABT8ELT6_9BURK|nr:efflux transporter outer membrane subunit [Alcaligenes endophyticus]MCX5591172.1 efflux transporter outer membrane subunit [Alcaligenes endophyticus]MDN4122250.1 efflux transporter outer membrane subunit [Alcaligenes endophyticus]
MKEFSLSLYSPKLRYLASMVTLMAVAGCGALNSTPTPSPLPVANHYPGQTASQDNAALNSDWRVHFTDPQLQQLISIALENNRDLQTAVLRVEEAQAIYGIQRSDQWPSLGIGAEAGRAKVPGDLNMSGQSMVSGKYEAYAGMSTWEVDLWGRVRSLKEAALQQYLATDSARRAVQISLISGVVNTWLSLSELNERLRLAEETIASRQASLDLFTHREAVGAASMLDLTQAQTLLIQAQSLAARLEQERAAQNHALALLLGAKDTPEQPAQSLAYLATHIAPVQPGLPAQLLTARPDIIAAEQRLLASHANIQAARAAFFPTITLTGAFGSSSAELKGLFDSGSKAWSFLPSISLPIFDGGRRQANLSLAEVRKDMAIVNYEKTIQTAFREVADALSNREWLNKQVHIQEQALQTQKQRAQLAQMRYDSGASGYLEVLDAQRSLLDAEQGLVQTRRLLLSNQVLLYAALGGGASPS